MSWTPEREAEVRARLERLAPVAADLAACLAELDRVREERDGMRARVLGYAAELERLVSIGWWDRAHTGVRAIAARLRELVAP